MKKLFIIPCLIVLAIVGCEENIPRDTYEFVEGQKLPELVWGDANNITFDAKYEFNYRGKRYVFTYPEKRSTDSCQGSTKRSTGNHHVVQTYRQWVGDNVAQKVIVTRVRNELGERFCVRLWDTYGTGKSHYCDVQTGEHLSEIRAVEAIDIEANLCKPEEQSADYRRAMELEKRYPRPKLAEDEYEI